MWGDRPGRHLPSAPRAFTLVELLVVIGIIGLLAAIITPVVMQSLTKARNAAIKAEIDMLHMAIMNYKNEYGSFPPCKDTDASGNPGLINKHLARLFPRAGNSIASAGQVSLINPQTAIVTWLSGYTDNPLSPISPDSERKKLYDFDQSRVSSLTYFPSGKSGSTYRYINSSQYPAYVYAGVNDVQLSNYGVQCTPPSPLPAKPSATTPDSWYFTAAAASPSTPQPFNPATFQILCAGRDEQFGTDDDLSNFWPGTRREFLDSLKD
jgi:prepilin-type N-terminal cleavage/methylation domain-containing protein